MNEEILGLCRAPKPGEEFHSVHVSPKVDGLRAFFYYDFVADRWTSWSRRGKPFYHCEKIHEHLDSIPAARDHVFDAEMLAEDWHLTSSIIRASKSKRDSAKLRAWIIDVVSRVEFDAYRRGLVDSLGMPLFERMEIMRTMVGDSRPFTKKRNPFNAKDLKVVEPIPHWMAKHGSNLTKNARSVQSLGGIFEGIVVKHIGDQYPFGGLRHWIKIKVLNTDEFPLRMITNGEGRHQDIRIGAMVIQSSKKATTNVGIGMNQSLTDEIREVLHKVWFTYEGVIDAEAFSGNEMTALERVGLQHGDDIRMMDFMVEVQYLHGTPDGRLREPKFVRFRCDK